MEKEVPVYGEYDVVVCGGGIAGVSAALAAARNGAKTLLIERAFGLGGLATLGLIVVYLPLCDGTGRQVSFGISEELLRLSIRHGWEALYPAPWLSGGTVEEKKKQRFEVQYNGNVFAILMEQKLLEENVKILYGTTVCDVSMKDDTVSAVYVENKSGRQAIIGKAFIDCTGDADIFKMAGEKLVINEEGNPLAAWYFTTENGMYTLHQYGVCDSREGKDGKKISSKRYQGIDAEEITEMVIDSHASVLNHFLSVGDVSREHALSTTAYLPMIRMTRRIKGAAELKKEDMFLFHEDSVGMVSDWRKPGPVFEVPFSTLHGTECRNLIAAGRLTAADKDMWDITRVIPSCAVTGEAAGTAAAMTSDFLSVNIKELQKRLMEGGVKLHCDEL